MMQKFRQNSDGATVVEFALTLPFLVTMLYAIMQFGIFFFATANMQHMLGEGARFATLFPTPADTAIVKKMEDARYTSAFGLYNVTITSNGRTKDLRVSYTATPHIPFYKMDPITVRKNKLVYLSI